LTSFTGVIVDEAHGATGKELQKILEQMTNASYRIGTTGTIQSEKVHKLVVEGFLGPSYQVITTKKLIDNKQVSGIKIRPVVLEYPVEDKDFCKKMDYQDETSFIISHQSRLTKVSKLTAGLPGTTLLLVSRRDDHAVPLYDEIKKYSKKPVYFVAGTVDAEDREEIRLKANTEDCIIVATYKTMSTGTNIPNIRNVVFGSTSKAMITILQSIGRGLRLHSDKESMLLIDFIDDLRYKKHENYAYQHSEVRMRIYRKEQFEISQPVKVML
jgi:superfamily II DNA or RNA helicase